LGHFPPDPSSHLRHQSLVDQEHDWLEPIDSERLLISQTATRDITTDWQSHRAVVAAGLKANSDKH